MTRTLILTFALLLGHVGLAQAQPTLVSENTATCPGTLSCAASSGIAVQAGDLLVAIIAVRSSDATAASATDATNGAWTCPSTAFHGSFAFDGRAGVCYFLASAAGTITPTVTIDGVTPNTIWLNFSAYRAPSGETWAYDEDSTQSNASGTTHGAGNITTTGPGAIVSVSSQSGGSSYTPGTGFTALSAAGGREYWQYRLSSTGVTTDGGYTTTGALASEMAVASWVYTGGGGGDEPTPKRLLLLGVGQ